MHAIINQAEGFLGWVVHASWQAAVLVCLILLMQILFGKKLSPAWRYGLWMLVVVRLALPATVQSAVSVFNLARTPVVPRIATRVSPDEPAETVLQTARSSAQPAPEPAEPATVAPAEPSARPEEAARAALSPVKRPAPAWDVRQGLIDIWIAAVLLMLIRIVYKNYRFSSFVVRRRPVTDEAVLNLLQDCKAEMNVHVPMDVVETRKVDSPALLGFVRPRLLLPPDMIKSFPRDKLRYFFLHELAHFKRGDIFVNWLTTLLQILHWFNPFVWLAFSRMRADREAACDAYVMSFCGDAQESRRYGEAIVDLVEFAARVHWLPGVVGILEEEKEMERRIAMITTFKQYPHWSRALAAGLIAALAVVTLTDAQSPAPAAPAAGSGAGKEARATPAGRPAKIEVGGQLVIVDSDAVPAIAKQLGMDLDPETGRVLLSKDEAADLVDALLAQPSARMVGEGSIPTLSGVNNQVMSARVVNYTTDKPWGRHVGWILNATPILKSDGGWVDLTVVPEWADVLGTRKTPSKEVPLFQSLNYTMSVNVPPGEYLLLHGSRAPLREFVDVAYAQTLAAETRGRAQDYFLLLSAHPKGTAAKTGSAAPENGALMVCRFLGLGPEAQKVLQATTGMRGISGSETLSAEKCRELLAALESSPDAETLAMAPIASKLGVNVQQQWVQEVIYESDGKFVTREIGLIFNITPVAGADGETLQLTTVVELAYPPTKQDPAGGFSPISINTVRSFELEPGQTVLSSVSADSDVLPPGHRCFLAVTARILGEEGVAGY